MTSQDCGAFQAFIKKQPGTTVLAERDGKLLGYVPLHHGETRWFRHLGEIRLLVAPKSAQPHRSPHGLQPEGRPPPV